MAQPSVSVIMPVRNEEAFIERSLGAMLRQDYPHDRLEILVVDGMSTDQTRKIVREMADQSDVRVRVIDNPARIVPPAMNVGIRAAQGDVIVRMDGHTIAEPDYVSACVQSLEESAADNVGGRMDCVGDTLLGKAIGAATSHPFGIGNAKFHYAREAQEVDTVYLGCWRKDAFDRFGEFDEYFLRTQDSEFNYRTRMLGGRVWLDPRIKSAYYNRASLTKLAKQYYQYGFWKTRLMFKLGGRLQLRHFAAPAFVCSLVISLILLICSGFLVFSHWASGLFLGGVALFVPALYVIAALSASIKICFQEKDYRYVFLLPLVFFVLHVSWGLGFLNGVLIRPQPDHFQPLRLGSHPRATPRALRGDPFISVVMPVRNEQAYIRESLHALFNQDYPRDRYEIIVADGMSTDATTAIVTEMAAASPVPVILLNNPKKHAASALNAGIKAARGEVILRMDGHVVAAADYLRTSVDTLKTIDADNVGGVVEYTGSNWLARLIGLAVSSTFGCGGAPARSRRQGYVDTVSFGCWRKEAFQTFGLFDEFFSKTQDSEFNYRTRLLGGKVWLNPAIKSHYFSRPSLIGLARQYFKYGYWKSRLVFKLGWRLSPRHFAPPLLVTGLAGCLGGAALIPLLPQCCAFWVTVRHFMVCAVLFFPAVYFLFCLLAAAALLRKSKHLASLVVLPVLYLIIHLNWGFGFILGFFIPPPPDAFMPLPTENGNR
ncbi:MAG: glycosyltransferase family 2 protein [Lentisphaeria bacterium]|nr:glycosyltransferase family 2 protein [Lentisphaeria bacterium]